MDKGYGVYRCFKEVYWDMQHANDSPREGYHLEHIKGNLEGLGVGTG